MIRLVIEGYLLLVRIDVLIRRGKFDAIDTLVRNQAVRRKPEGGDVAGRAAIRRAMDLACVFYVKPVLCLQCSSAMTVQLRRHGWPAEMVVGAQMVPFEFHAWVELDGKVLTDKPYVRERYRVLERN
jgi:hypothetical protein